jgi:hypothetical protein
MTTYSKKVFLISLALAISSCGGIKYPKMLSFTPASVMIDYSDSDLHQATAMAQQYCASINKDAQYLRTEQEGSMLGLGPKAKHGFFNCVESNRAEAVRANGGGNASNIPIINNFK